MSKYFNLEIYFGKEKVYACVVRKHKAKENYQITDAHVTKIVIERFGKQYLSYPFLYKTQEADNKAYHLAKEKINIFSEPMPQSSH